MGTRYRHLTIEEWCELARLHAAGHSIRQIAAALDRPPSTVARELRRNGSKSQDYQPSYAQQQARARRWRGSKLERDGPLRLRVLSRLEQGHSPEQVSGRLALEAGRPVISHETICRFIYAQLARTKNYAWRHYLPRAKSKRGRRGRKGGSPASFIAGRRPLSERPPEAAGRQTPGHWEADLMLFGKRGPVLLVMQERHSCLMSAVRLPGKAAEPVADALAGVLASFPPQWRRTVAFDNGTEFAGHCRLHELGAENLLLRRTLALAKGRGGKPHRPPAPLSAPQNGSAGAVRCPAGATGPGLQQHPAQVPGLPYSGRSLFQSSVALEM